MKQIFDLLFKQSPTPKIIFRKSDLKIIEVNEKACNLYGYTCDEFMTLAIPDLEFVDSKSGIRLSLSNYSKINITKNKKKNGDVIHVQYQSQDIDYQGVEGCLMIITDLTLILDLQEKVYLERFATETEVLNAQLQHKKDLEDSENRLETLLNNSEETIAIINSSGKCLFVTKNVEAKFGYKSEVLLTSNVFDFIHPDDMAKVQATLASIPSGKSQLFTPYRIKDSAGNWRWIRCVASNYSDKPIIGGIVMNVLDITEQKNQDDKLKRLSKIAEQTVNAVIITDLLGKIIWTNTAFTEITGFSAQEALGKKPSSFLQGPDTDPDTVKKMSEHLERQEGFEVEIINYTKEKKPYWMQIQCQPEYDNSQNLVGFFAIQTDVTERRKLEERIKFELAERQKTITKAIVNAQENERREIGRELHDNVNQMLSTIKLYLGLIKDPAFNEEGFIDKCILIVQDTINETRRLSHILTADLFTTLDLDTALEELVKSLSVASRIKFDFDFSINKKKTFDHKLKLAIYRIAQEHLTNVLKHSEATNVNVSLVSKKDALYLEVLDDGKGFDVEKNAKGIGLINIKQRAIAIGGDVKIKSMIGQGTSLSAQFPLM